MIDLLKKIIRRIRRRIKALVSASYKYALFCEDVAKAIECGLQEGLGIISPSEYERRMTQEYARQRIDDDPEILCDVQYCPFMIDGGGELCYGDYCDEARENYFEVHGIEEGLE